MKRAGCTLTELVIAVLVVVLVWILAVTLLTRTHRDARSLSLRLHELQANQVLRTRLAADLACFHGLGSRSGPADSARLTFSRVTGADRAGVFGTCLDPRLAVLAEEVTYEFDRSTHCVKRSCRGRTEIVKPGRFQDVSFEVADPEKGGGEIRVRTTWLPEELLDRGPGNEAPQRVERSFSYSLLPRALGRIYGEWVRSL